MIRHALQLHLDFHPILVTSETIDQVDDQFIKSFRDITRTSKLSQSPSQAQSQTKGTGPTETVAWHSWDETSSVVDDNWLKLKIAAETGNIAAFKAATYQIDWPEQGATAFVEAVRLALAAGAHMLARHLSAEGARLHPNHPELRKMAYILAPPTVTRTKSSPQTDVVLNQQWLRQNAEEYKGQWVALRAGKLVASAWNMNELGGKVPNTTGLMIAKV